MITLGYYETLFFELYSKNDLKKFQSKYKSLVIYLYPFYCVVNESYNRGWVFYFKNPTHETLALLELKPLIVNIERTYKDYIIRKKRL